MERNEIRGALACFAYAAEANQDDDLAAILNLVHAAILHNDTHRLVQHLQTYDVMVYPGNDEATIPSLGKWIGLVERVVE